METFKQQRNEERNIYLFWDEHSTAGGQDDLILDFERILLQPNTTESI